MALTISNLKRIKLGNAYAVTADITFDKSYDAGGEPLTARNIGLNVLTMLMCEPQGGYTFEYDHTNKKVKAMVPISAAANEGVADANNTLIKGATSKLEVAGTGTAFQVAGQEVTDEADLSTLTTKIMAIGW